MADQDDHHTQGLKRQIQHHEDQQSGDVKLCAEAYWDIMNAKTKATRHQQIEARLSLESKNLDNLNRIKRDMGIA